MANATTWFYVIGAHDVPGTSRPAYSTRALALAKAAANNHEYPALAPYRVVELVETGSVFKVGADAQAEAVQA